MSYLIVTKTMSDVTFTQDRCQTFPTISNQFSPNTIGITIGVGIVVITVVFLIGKGSKGKLCRSKNLKKCLKNSIYIN